MWCRRWGYCSGRRRSSARQRTKTRGVARTISSLFLSRRRSGCSSIVDEHLRLLVASLSKAGNKNDFVKRIGDVIEISQDMRRRDFRVTRCRLIAHTDKSPRFSVLLGKEQVRINNDFTAFFLQLQARGWMGSKLSPATAAVIIQALTLGRTVDDVSADRLSPASWNEAFMTIVKDVILSSAAEQTGV